MGINYEMERYTELTGEDGTKVNISRLGGYLDGYDKGRADAIDEFIKLCDSYCYFNANKHPSNGYVISRASLLDIADKLKENK